MAGDEVLRPDAIGDLVQFPLCVYGDLRVGQSAHRSVLADGDLAAVLPAQVPGYRLYVISRGQFEGCALAWPTEDDLLAEPMVAELLVPYPQRYAAVLTKIRRRQAVEFRFDVQGMAFVEHQIGVELLVGDGAYRSAVPVQARMWLPGRPMLLAASRGYITAVAGNDWRTRPGPAGPDRRSPHVSALPAPSRDQLATLGS